MKKVSCKCKYDVGKGSYNKDVSLCKTSGVCAFIKIEYLVANVLVELYENRKINRVSFKDIEKYGMKVVEKLNIREKSKAILLYSNQYIKEFLYEYREYFICNDSYIQINNKVSTNDIREHILSNVSTQVLLVMLEEPCLCSK